jgi:signal transduction histidine kinase
VIDVLARAMRLAVGSAACLLVAAALVGRAARKGTRVAPRLLAGTVALAGLASSLRAAEPETRVLILNASDPYLPAYLVIDAAMRETLAKDTTRRFVYFSEPLDAQRFDWKKYEPEYLSLLVKKYKGLRIDVVVAVTRPALDFVNDHGKELWPDARIVFHGVSARTLENTVLPPHVTGVVAREDLGGTLDLARRLQPQARRILVIAGVSDIDQYLIDETRRVLAGRPQTAEVKFLLGLPQRELVERVKREAADTIILYLAQFRDRDGRPYTPREVLRAISAVSPAPIYGPSETFVGYGTAGGVVESFEDRGRIVAERILAVSAGESPTPALADVPARCITDAGALRRWSLDEARLPEGCENRFAERPFWREYPLQTFGALAVVLLQAALIAVLLVERRRRHAAELELRRRLLEVVHLNRTAAAGVLSASVAHELTQPLGAIQSYAEAAEVYLKADPSNVGRIETILAAIRRDDERAVDIIRRLRGLFRKRTEIELQDFDLNDTIRSALDILVPEATKRGVELSVNQSAVALPVRADQVQLQQVILNLALNGMDALQNCASDKRKMAIQSSLVGKSAVEVVVSDSGTGIAGDKLAAIFEPFYTTKPQGTGLGLSISRAIVEAYSGKIWAENRPGGGATFRFTLPVAKEGAS